MGAEDDLVDAGHDGVDGGVWDEEGGYACGGEGLGGSATAVSECTIGSGDVLEEGEKRTRERFLRR